MFIGKVKRVKQVEVEQWLMIYSQEDINKLIRADAESKGFKVKSMYLGNNESVNVELYDDAKI